MDYLLQQIAEHIILVIIGVFFLAAMILRAGTKVVTALARERSRREIAAYIAEGSMSPEQGERILAADVQGRSEPGA